MKPKTDGSMQQNASDSYPNFVVFIVLGHKGSLVISFPINRIPRDGGEVSTQSSLSLAIVTF
jgi:hypothetical protein